jgi:hypothetical protein
MPMPGCWTSGVLEMKVAGEKALEWCGYQVNGQMLWLDTAGCWIHKT